MLVGLERDDRITHEAQLSRFHENLQISDD